MDGDVCEYQSWLKNDQWRPTVKYCRTNGVEINVCLLNADYENGFVPFAERNEWMC